MLAAPAAPAQTANPAASPPPASPGPIAVVPAPPPREDTVGPAQLRNFSLGGPNGASGASANAPAPAATTPTPPPAVTRPAPAPAPASPPRSEPSARPAQAPAQSPAAGAPGATDSAPAAAIPPGFSPAIHQDELEVAAPYRVPAMADERAPRGLLIAGGGLALLLGLWFLQRRRRQRLAFAAERSRQPSGPVDYAVPSASPRLARPERLQPAPPAEPVAPPAPPPPVAAGPARDGGVVATGLKPALSPHIEARRLAVLDDGSAVLDLALEVRNDGSAAARGVQLSMKLVNVGPAQETDLAAFFRDPNRRSAALPDLQPADRVTLNVDVTLPAADVRAVEMEGRRLFIPLLALTLGHRGQPAQPLVGAWLVGSGDEDAARLAPFRLDRGARQWDKVALRAHVLGELRG